MRVTSIMRFDISSSISPSAFAAVSPVEDFALTPAERHLFLALNNRGVRYILLGMGAALLEGAPVATQDLDVWFERIDDERIKLAAKDAGGFWISGFGAQPPAFGGAKGSNCTCWPANGLLPASEPHKEQKNSHSFQFRRPPFWRRKESSEPEMQDIRTGVSLLLFVSLATVGCAESSFTLASESR